MEIPQYREPIFDTKTANEAQELFHSWLGKHISADENNKLDERFILLENNPENYYFQSVNIIHIPPNPEASLDKIMMAGEIVMGPSFLDLVSDFKTHTKELKFVKELLQDPNKPQSISLLTDHGQLINNALVQAALLCSLEDESLIDHNVSVLNHMITFMGFRVGQLEPIPAIEVVRGMGHIVKAVPRTSSAKQAGLDDKLADPMNSRMLSEIRPLIRAGVVLDIAPSGTTDKLVNIDGQPTLLMHRATTSAAKLTALCKYGWAVETDFKNPSAPRWNILGILPLKSPDDVHQRMEEIARSHSQYSGIQTRYETEQEAENRNNIVSNMKIELARTAIK